ncbi:MAG: DUF362 domain-containing protein [Prevotella sp.]
MRRTSLLSLLAIMSLACMAQKPKVYLTREITPEALVRIYHAVGRKAEGNVAVKISTGEAGNPNYLKPELIAPLVKLVKGTIVECNTAYGGKRSKTEEHLRVAEEHGFTAIAPVDIMDAEGEIRIAVRDTSRLKYDIVGGHLSRYTFLINLSHFKGHPMGGLGGALKNQSIGIASANGKAYIHTAGKQETVEGMWKNVSDQDGFLESMAAAAQGVADYFGDRILYINVMNNMSVDCDCVAHPAAVSMKDYGILASTDPVALDKACADIIFNMPADKDNDSEAMIERINSRHGMHTIEYAERIGLGSTAYELVSIDTPTTPVTQ